MYRLLAIFAGIAFFFSACSIKEQTIEASQPITLIIKAPYVKLSGVGFHKTGGRYTNLQIFSAGIVMLDYKSANSICVNSRCMTRGIFNENLFLYPHYDELIDDILAQRPLYKSQNLIKTESGFSQHITKAGAFDIVYEVNGTSATFNDLQNAIMIQITKIGKEQ
ncbi:MAG: hypothetical protein LBH45_03310 [Campylobacteraceae bacterium]|jgi:hypothetical protein|nr:hypothetical protein [Campylobacteraceae bacterium]